MNQKGMEMAIQIFIVLFVLLAVSMLVLQLVSTQFTQNETQLRDVQQKAAFDQKFKTNQVTCDSLCSGTESQLMAYCMTSFDFREGTLSEYDAIRFLPGIGVCTDRVYCNQITSCGLGISELNTKKCAKLLCNSWVEQLGGQSDKGAVVEATKLLRKYLTSGTCVFDEDNIHWFNISFPKGEDDLDCGKILGLEKEASPPEED